MNAIRRTSPGILIATHSHPAISKGGAELAAWRLFEGVQARPDWQAWFMGCAREAGGGRLGSVITQPFSANEFLYNSNSFDWFKFANQDPKYPGELRQVLQATRPDILHFHHYVNFGLETFMLIKQSLPDSRTIMTLHEYQAICNHYGQMVTREKKGLCYASSPRECNKCFPEYSRSDFFLRESYIKRFFDHIDYFVSPSQFLADRYVAWGVPAERITVIENVTAGAAPPDMAEPLLRTGTFQVGFFGQISYLKGIHVLLAAAALLEAAGVTDITFEIHGDYSGQPPEFQQDFLTRLEKAGPNVHFHGPYENARVDALMRSVDLVLIPSIWWENSPVVIQECLRNRKPIVCSNIGGMAEKVRPGKDGFHFPVGSAQGLAELLASLARDRERLARLSRTMRHPDPPESTVAEHVALYERLLERRLEKV